MPMLKLTERHFPPETLSTAPEAQAQNIPGTQRPLSPVHSQEGPVLPGYPLPQLWPILCEAAWLLFLTFLGQRLGTVNGGPLLKGSLGLQAIRPSLGMC